MSIVRKRTGAIGLDSLVGTNYNAIVLAEPSLMMFWRFAEASGTSIVDYSSFARNGTYYNSPTLGAGSLTTDQLPTVTLNGSTQYGEIAYNSWMNQSSLTVEMIGVNYTTPGSGSGMVWAARDDEVTNRSWLMRVGYQGTMEVIVFNAGSFAVAATSAGYVVGNTPAHWAFTYDQSNIRLYKNGTQVASNGLTGGARAAVISISVGRSQYGRFYQNGRFGAFAMYNAALSGQALADHARLAGY